MLKPPDIDPLAVRRQFSRRASTLPGADFLYREVESRMFDRLELIRLEPQRALDVGCGLGEGLAQLATRFPAARCVGIDSATGMLAGNRFAPPTALSERLRRLPGRWSERLGMRFGTPVGHDRVRLVEADAGVLPLGDGQIDLLWSNMAWHWFADPPAVAREWQRVIRPGGLLMFSAFGVDTLRELRRLGAQLPEFPDLHDIGDLLGQTGFVDPVMDTERLTVNYDDPARLLADWHAMAGNASRERRRGCSTPRQRQAWSRVIEQLRGSDGRLHVSVEVVYAHAWRGRPAAAGDGYQPIQWTPRRSTGPTPL